MSKDQTLVIFRRRRETGTIIAVFPTIPTDSHGWFLGGYEHGQYCSVDYYTILKSTSPATLQESACLAKELKEIGYNLKRITRASEGIHLARYIAAKAGTILQFKAKV